MRRGVLAQCASIGRPVGLHHAAISGGQTPMPFVNLVEKFFEPAEVSAASGLSID